MDPFKGQLELSVATFSLKAQLEALACVQKGPLARCRVWV